MKFKPLFFTFSIILSIIFFTNFSSAVQIGISPPQLEFKANLGEKVCKEMFLFSEQKEKFTGSDTWTNLEDDFKNIKKYNKNSSFFKINLEYKKELTFKEKADLKICISGNNPGEYYGAIIYSTNKSVAVGSWINLKVYGNDNFNKDFDKNINENNLVTGKIINLEDVLKNKSSLLFLVFSFFMLIVLCYILILLFKIKRREDYQNN